MKTNIHFLSIALLFRMRYVSDTSSTEYQNTLSIFSDVFSKIVPL